MRVLLLGATGLVGRHVRAALAGHEVIATARDGDETMLALDVTDSDALAAAVRRHKPTVIVNAAAEAHVERCEAEPERTRSVNVTPVAECARLATQLDAALVVFSSEYVFDGSAGEYDEADAVGPLNEYGRQKVEAERLAARVPRHLVCRTSGVFGWEPLRKNFVCQLVDRLRDGNTFAVPADQRITPTWAPALGAAVVELVRTGCRGTYHVVGPEIVERSAFARMVARAFDLPEELLEPRPTADLGLRAARPRAAGLRDGKLRATLGHALLAPAEALGRMRLEEVA